MAMLNQLTEFETLYAQTLSNQGEAARLNDTKPDQIETV